MKGDVMSNPGRFGPLQEGHPAVGTTCPLCDAPLEVGQRPALIEIGPADAEEEEKAAAGRVYTTTCDIVHEDCVWPPD